LLLLLAVPLAAQAVFDTPDPLDDDYVTGVAIGEEIPWFRIPDLNGKLWDFDAIKGPEGALLLFYRSADW
jgi:hypothetical protein